MVDTVYGEMASAEPIDEDWRDAIRTIAHRIRRATHEHGWFVELLGSRPHLGPNALVHLEEAFVVGVCDLDEEQREVENERRHEAEKAGDRQETLPYAYYLRPSFAISSKRAS